MMKITLTVAAAAAMLMTALVSGTFSPATAAPLAGVQMAQVDVQIGRDRDRDWDRRRDRDVTVGVGPGGIHVGPRQRCHTRTTWVERSDGRRIKRTERICD